MIYEKSAKSGRAKSMKRDSDPAVKFRRGRKAGLGMLLLVLAVILVSCRSKERVTLSVLNPEWSQPDEAPRAQEVAERFTKQTNIGVRYVPVPESSSGQLEISRRLLQEHSSVPDVLAIDVIWPGALADDLIDLRPYLEDEIAALDPKLVAAFTVGGRVVAIPYHAHIGVLEYRIDLLHKYGFDRPPRTWTELEHMAVRIQTGERAEGKKDFWGYVWQGAGAEPLTCNALEWQVAEGGGQIIEADGTISVNNPAAIRSWERAHHWIGWISPPGVIAYRELDSLNLFDSGLAAFRRTWQWRYRLTHWQGPMQPENLGYAGMPGGPGGRAGTLGGIGLAISRYSVSRQEAIALVRFLIREELQSRDEGASTKTPEYFDLPSLLEPHGRFDERGASAVVSRPSAIAGSSYEKVTKVYYDAVHSVLTGEIPASQAAADLEKNLTQVTGFKSGPPKERLVVSSSRSGER
jgi:trehalose/maltose transport system substrate-binding protein